MPRRINSSNAPMINGRKVTVVQKTVAVLAQLRTLGIETPMRDRVIKMCGFGSEGSFKVIMAKEAKKKDALVELPDRQTITLTPAGIEAVPKEDPITNDAEQQEYVKKVFNIGGNPGKMFDLMRDGKIHTDHELAIACGRKAPNASHKVQRATLTRHGVVEKTSCGGYRLSSMCYFKK